MKVKVNRQNQDAYIYVSKKHFDDEIDNLEFWCNNEMNNLKHDFNKMENFVFFFSVTGLILSIINLGLLILFFMNFFNII